MNKNYEQQSKITCGTDIDIIRSLEQRSTGFLLNNNSYCHDFEVHAEDVFVRKKFNELRCEMPGISRSTFLMVFSPDGSKVASTHGNHNVYVTDVRSGKNIKTLVGHPRTPWCIAFHPTSNQILASGCLGGQVRIWDLSGGSEIWTSEIPTVIASLAFHPDDRLLVIATYNELYFWDWSKPEPFIHVATASIKEKVRYVAFDKLGHKLITGISNSPQTRWERVRAPVPVPRQVDRSASPYRRRITPRLISNMPATSTTSEPIQNSSNVSREPLTTVPERERRITACYRNLVREYELLVHRYLQIYRPPTMIDQGTDPMEIDLNSITGRNSQHLNGNNSQSRTTIDAVNNTNRHDSAASVNFLPRRALFDTSEISSPQTQFSSGSSTSVNNISMINSDHRASPSAVSTHTTSESFNGGSTNSTSQNDRFTTNDQQIVSQSPDLAPVYEGVAHLEGDSLPLNSSETEPLISTNSASTALTRQSLHVSPNENSTTILANKNDERNSISPATRTFQQLDQHRPNVNLQLPSDIFENPVNNIPKLMQPDETLIRILPLRNYNGSNSSTNSSNLLNNTANEMQREMLNSTDMPTKSCSQSTVPNNQRQAAIRLEDTYKNSQETHNNSKEYTETLKEADNLSSNIPKSDSVESTGVEDREHSIKHLQINLNNVSRKTSDAMGIENTHLNGRQNRNTNILEAEPRPSTSGIHTRPPENCDYCCSDSKCQPKKENTRFYNHSRKRNYTSLFKRTRRAATDSSSAGSSSEDDKFSSKRLCTAKLCSLSTKPPDVDSNSNGAVNACRASEQESDNMESSGSINLNRQLEVLVTDFLMHNAHIIPSVDNVHGNQSTSKATNPADRVCQSCGNFSQTQSGTDPCNIKSSKTNKSHACPKSSDNTHTRTTNSTTYTSSGNQRCSSRPGRFFSHRASAFYPTRIPNLRPHTRLRRSASYLSPIVRNRLRILNTLQNSNRLPSTFAMDEVINYSERVPTEDISESHIGFHPFDPPPEFASINPENIGIGNMYSNIVQELESSLNDVRNIRASNRLGETSDMLSSFSERLESIMNQSNAILRNLRTSIDTLQPNNQNISSPNNGGPAQTLFASSSQPRISFSDSSFYLREQTNNHASEENNVSEGANLGRSSSQDDIFSNHNNSVATDHTYPLNSRNSETTANSMSPLMASLHLTVSHIQRQARLLRQQVESIERIDRAMLEVAQLQMMRQMFIEIQCYFRAAPWSENRSSLSRVRQMMAGTRISDSSPYDSPNEDSTIENHNDTRETELNTNENNTNIHQNTTINSNSTRKSYPRCIFLMQRHFRRGSVGNILQRRCLSRERLMRRHSFRKSFTYRSLISRIPTDLTTNRNPENVNQLSSETLRSLTRRLETFLMEHGRHIGRVLEPSRNSTTSTDKDEYVMMLRLNQCRTRILGQESPNSYNIRRQTNSVTTDGSVRYNAREVLTASIESLSGYIVNGTNITPSLRILIWNVVDLSLLLSEILLLQIVDSIPPPSGMNLDSERESLSTRIDQMCSRMLQNRLSGHSQQLTRSLRLTRLAVRHAARALNQTYTARRNSMLPTGRNRDQRRMLLEEINNCLRNIRRHGIVTQMSNERAGSNSENLSRTQWYRTIHSLIAGYRSSTLSQNSQIDSSSNNTNTDNSAQTDTFQTGGMSRNYIQVSSDDDNESRWYNSHNNNIHSNDERGDRTRPLYRTNNVNLFNLLNNEQNPSLSPRNRPWNVPTVQINDVPISQYQSQWHPRFMTNRQRVPERISELRTYPVGGVYRPRFLHPLHAGNPFEADFDESVREQIYDSDIMTPITPNHRIQVWEFSSGIIPNIDNVIFKMPKYAVYVCGNYNSTAKNSNIIYYRFLKDQTLHKVWTAAYNRLDAIKNALKNVVVNECKIHNDASVDIANNGNILVTLLPSGGYLNGTNRLGVYSLKWETLGQCLYVTNFEQNAVSVSLSPLSRHLIVGLASRRVSVVPSEKWTMARIFLLDYKSDASNQLLSVREVEQTRDPNYMSVNCIRWLPISGQGLVYATNTGQLRILT